MSLRPIYSFFFNDPPTTDIYTLSLHDALPISPAIAPKRVSPSAANANARKKQVPRSAAPVRSEEHTSELQSRFDLVCRLLLEKKNIIIELFAPTIINFGPISG